MELSARDRITICRTYAVRRQLEAHRAQKPQLLAEWVYIIAHWNTDDTWMVEVTAGATTRLGALRKMAKRLKWLTSNWTHNDWIKARLEAL